MRIIHEQKPGKPPLETIEVSVGPNPTGADDHAVAVQHPQDDDATPPAATPADAPATDDASEG